jgi:hypothetical protein
MHKFPIYLLTLLLSTSCSEKKVNEKITSDSTSNISSIDQKLKSEKFNKETKLSSIRDYGQKIIDNEIQPSDNNETFACLDSIDDDNLNTRKFFFQVYRVIAKKSDGALGEVVGSYTKSYFQTFPIEALYNFKNLPSPEQKLFIDNLAFEFYASGTDYKADIDNFFSSIYSSCEKCKAETEILERIKNDLIVEVSRIND